MYYPTFEKVQEIAAALQGHATDAKQTEETRRPLLPLSSNLLADVETPVSAYCKAARGPYSFLLESVAGGEQIARYSFIGLDPYLVLTHRGETATLRQIAADGSTSNSEVDCHDPLDIVQAELGQYFLVPSNEKQFDELPRFHGGAVGYLAYETVARFEQLPVPEKDSLNLPLAIFCFTETVLVFDHLKHRVRVVTHLHLDAPDLAAEYARCSAIIADVQQRLHQELRFPPEPERNEETARSTVTSNRSKAEFEAMVETAKEYIRAGDIFQVVLSQRLSRPVNSAPFTIYRALRTINPSPYMFFLDLEEFYIIGASPELLVRVEEGEVTIHPIAGSRGRGATPEQDDALAEELRSDPKERAEHVMLLDLGRNDVGRVSQPGTVQVTNFMEIERYSHIMHLVSNVVGQLRPDVSAYDALRSGFPAGTVSGAPKIRAMEIISELEGEQRGVYAGAIGYFSHSGNLDTAIALRTMVVKDGQAYVQAGGGLVADSVPADEYQESLNKAGALLRALDMADEIAANQEKRGHTHVITH
ncbi:MAG TPA: anthranilate synthase component I [Ktedonobacteraceae bacterium]